MANNDLEFTLQCGSITVEVERLQPMLDTGACVAFAKVRFKTPVGSISIDNFRLLKGKNGGYFVVPPAHKKEDRWYDDVKVTEDLEKYLSAAVKKAYQESTH